MPSSSKRRDTSCNSNSLTWWGGTSSTSSGGPDGRAMAMHRLAAVDAQMYWMSAKIPNDQFLLYGFAGLPSDLDRALDVIRRRAWGSPELGLRIEERTALTYPAWVTAPIEPEQFVMHDLADNSWAGCLAAAAGLAEHQLDSRRTAWRLHVFAP